MNNGCILVTRLDDAKGIKFTRYNNRLEKLSTLGQTPMLLAVDDQIVGIIAVSDPIKKDSAQAVQRLKNQGLRIIMVTGDNQITAHAIAKQRALLKSEPRSCRRISRCG